MKAIVATAYGPPDVLPLKEVEKPTFVDRDAEIAFLNRMLNNEQHA